MKIVLIEVYNYSNIQYQLSRSQNMLVKLTAKPNENNVSYFDFLSFRQTPLASLFVVYIADVGLIF